MRVFDLRDQGIACGSGEPPPIAFGAIRGSRAGKAARPMKLLVAAFGIACFSAIGFGGEMRLIDAAKAGDRGAVASLLKQHADANAAEPDGTTAIFYAVRADDLELTDQLIRAGANVKAANRYGVNALYLACVNGNPAMIERLIKAGADVNAASTEGETPLMTASRGGRLEAVKVLLARGAEVNAREEWRGQTALMWAVAQSHPDIVKELIAHGADVNGRSAFQKWDRQVTAEPREKWMPQGSLTPLLFATRQGCLECARILIEAGANPNAADLEGVTPMISAIINGHYDVAAFLAEKGADVNLADKTGRTALYAAVDFHTMPDSNRPSPRDVDSAVTSMELIQSLIARGADVNAQLKTQVPYRTKLDRGDDTMLTTGTTPILRAAKSGDTEVIRLLLAKGASLKLATRQGITPLLAAAGVGTKEEDNTGRRKTEKEAIDSIELCLKAGADINEADNRGQTAVYGAAVKGWNQVIQYLADHGAKLDAKDKRGFTALDAALGKAGGFGFDGAAGVVRDSTAALIRQLTAGRSSENTAANNPEPTK